MTEARARTAMVCICKSARKEQPLDFSLPISRLASGQLQFLRDARDKTTNTAGPYRHGDATLRRTDRSHDGKFIRLTYNLHAKEAPSRGASHRIQQAA